MATKLKVIRTWVRRRGTDLVFQLTKKMAEREPPRLGVDLDIISEAEAMAIRKRGEDAKKQSALDRSANEVSEALERGRQVQAQVELEAKARAKMDAAIAAQGAVPTPEGNPVAPVVADPAAVAAAMVPEGPEAAEARLAAEEAQASGGETGAIKADDLGEMNRKELFAVIEAEELDIAKKGTNAAVITAIRETRKLVEKAKADAERQAAAATE